MSVSITDRPIGSRLSEEVPITLVEDYGGLALVNVTNHGMSDGNSIYLLTNRESYNGFIKVKNVIDANSFTIMTVDNETIYWIADAYGYFRYQLFEHNFSCVHLPIVYKLESTLFPYSQTDGVYEFSMYGFIDGYFAIADLSVGALGYASVSVGDYVALYNHTNLKRVVAKQAPNRIVLDWDGSSLEDTTNTLDPSNTTYLIGIFQKYYNNYHIKVQIYAGLRSSHYWTTQKPYRLISTNDLVPDNNNQVMFSISNELMSDIRTLTNNLFLDTLPNNIDAFTMFYITTQEVYDVAGSTSSGSITSDQETFEGYAVNAKLEFKNLYSGYLSKYVVTNTDQFDLLGIPAAKFLTAFERPTVFSGHYFDISALVEGVLDPVLNYLVAVVEYLDENGNVGDTVYPSFPDNSLGVYRFQVEADCDYPTLRFYIYYGQDGYNPDVTERLTMDISCGCKEGIYITWLNYLGGFDYWMFTASTDHQVDIKEATSITKNIFPTWPTSYGETANTIRQEASRTSALKKTVRSQSVTLENLEALKYIKTSSLVQVVVSEFDLRTVIIDTDSFMVYNDDDKLFYIEFTMEYTDFIPAQTL